MPAHLPGRSANDGGGYRQLSCQNFATGNRLSSASSPHNTQAKSPPAIASLLAERRQRLVADKATKDAKERNLRKQKAEARKAAISADPESAMAKQAKYVQEVEEKKREEREARERVLAKIEGDRIARREKEREERKRRGRAVSEEFGAPGSMNHRVAGTVRRGGHIGGRGNTNSGDATMINDPYSAIVKQAQDRAASSNAAQELGRFQAWRKERDSRQMMTRELVERGEKMRRKMEVGRLDLQQRLRGEGYHALGPMGGGVGGGGRGEPK